MPSLKFGPVTKTKLVVIPKELALANRCEFPSPGCGRTPKYYLAVNMTYKSRAFESNQGMFLCELHKKPRIRVWDDRYKGELRVHVDWIVDKEKNLVKRWPTEKKKELIEWGKQ